MRLLILSCNTGEGHNSAAKAIREYFLSNNDECDIKDALAFWSPEKSKLISKGHVLIYRKFPKLFGVSYRFEENHPPKDGDESLIYELVIKGCNSLYEFLQTEKYDAVVCTHVFSAMMMTELKKRRKINIRSYFVATDYTCSPGVNQTAMDAYFIPHKKLIKEFADNGLPMSRIIPSGIPVRRDFYNKTEPQKAKRTLSLPQDKRVALLMCGSMGCGPIKDLAELLPQQLPEDALLVIICGNNVKLYRSLTKYPLPENVRVIGFTSRMPLYMDAAELILTKPGGLSTTEAAVKTIALVHTAPIPGVETANVEFFRKNGLAVTGDTLEELMHNAMPLLESEQTRAEMRARQSAVIHRRTDLEICDYIEMDYVRVHGHAPTP